MTLSLTQKERAKEELLGRGRCSEKISDPLKLEGGFAIAKKTDLGSLHDI